MLECDIRWITVYLDAVEDISRALGQVFTSQERLTLFEEHFERLHDMVALEFTDENNVVEVGNPEIRWIFRDGGWLVQRRSWEDMEV